MVLYAARLNGTKQYTLYAKSRWACTNIFILLTLAFVPVWKGILLFAESCLICTTCAQLSCDSRLLPHSMRFQCHPYQGCSSSWLSFLRNEMACSLACWPPGLSKDSAQLLACCVTGADGRVLCIVPGLFHVLCGGV